MNKDIVQAYGELSSLFYDALEQYACEQEVDFFASYIEQHPGRVLEAMSGSGRLQIPLMQRGYVVDGVDISAPMLARCRQRCAKLGLAPELYEQSLENLSLPHAYNTVIIAFGSFQLITDKDCALKALKNLNTHMVVGGTLFIDIFEPDVTLDEISMSTVRLDKRTVIRLTKRHVFDIEKKLAQSFCLYELLIDGIVQQQEDELIELVWRSDAQWHDLLLKAGFNIIRISDEIGRKSQPTRVIHAQSISQ